MTCDAPRDGTNPAVTGCMSTWIKVGTCGVVKPVAMPARELTDRELSQAIQEGPFERAAREAEEANRAYFANGGERCNWPSDSRE